MPDLVGFVKYIIPNFSAQASVTVGNTTVSGSISVSHHAPLQQVPKENFASAASAGYTVVANVPSSNFALNAQAPAQTTLTATTDTGYTSTITVNLEPVPSTTSPIGDGYTVYTFSVPNTSQLNSWIQSVTQNSNSTLNVTADTKLLFNDLGNSGTYSFYVQINNSQGTALPPASASYYDPGSRPHPAPCAGGRCPDQP